MTLDVSGLTFAYEGRRVLEGVTFHVEKGEFLSVLGPNGAGKTTLFKCVLGLLESGGTIRVDGQDIRQLSPRQMAQKIAYIPQVNRPAFGYTVLDTVLMSAAHRLPPFSGPQREHREQALSALERVGVADLAERNFSRLSGGEQQLVLVARALAQQSRILVMDEPTSSLDYGNQYRVLQKVRSLTQDGYTVLLSTHNPQHALGFSSRVLALKGGRVTAFGATEAVLTAKLVRELYGVEVEFVRTAHGCAIVPSPENGIP
ncbi:MAG: ABC transporter ATP-binding protein [Eubacteriales bacterium]|nr:ABC transporter ATP-binding protein [Eubacteriales bacterium]